ncbi:MAG TPA: hypothetical protein VNF74_03000 [Terriglobales bacterium]|nr:hypothetical protein [Terriglobales bacterium]
MSHLLPLWMVRPLACGVLAAALGTGLRAQAPAAGPGGWRVSGELAQGVDSNIELALDHPQADTTTQLQLGLERSWSGPHWSFRASYDPTAVAYARHPKLDYLSNAYQQVWSYALGPHTQIIWRSDAERYPERGGAPTGGLAPLAATANASQAMALGSVLTGANTNFALNHQYSLRSNWSASVSGGLQAFSADTSLGTAGASGFSPTALLGHTHTVAANLGWSYRVGSATSVQVGAEQSFMTYSGLGQQVRYSNVQASVQQKIGSVLSLQLGAGPAWNHTLTRAAAAAAFHLPGTSYAANAILAAHSGRSQYGLSWQHGTQAGFTPGGLTTDVLALQYSLQWSPSWSAGLSVGQSRNAAASTTAAGGPTQDSGFASAQLLCRVASRWSLQANASYFTQAEPTARGATQPFRRLQASIGLSYTSGGAQ